MKNRLEKNGYSVNAVGSLTPNKIKSLCLKSIRGKKQKHYITLQDHEVPAYTREPYIKTGYRFGENISLHQCVATLFTVHNETFNIWSHIFATIATISYAVWYLSEQQVIGNAKTYPLICFAICVALALSTSAFAHLFCCMSWRVRNACFYLDYASISLSTFSAGQAYIFYSRPLDANSSVLYQNPYIFLTISLTLSGMNMFLSCLSRHRLLWYRFLIRTGLYLIKFLFDISPFVSRCFITQSTCNSSTVFHFNRMFLCFAISGVVNASRMPERFAPGVFDLLGHSHHVFHVLIAIGNYHAFVGFYEDMNERTVELSASPHQPTFLTTFGLHFGLIVVNGFILKWFVNNWLTAEEEELFGSAQYMEYEVIYRKTNYKDDEKIE